MPIVMCVYVCMDKPVWHVQLLVSIKIFVYCILCVDSVHNTGPETNRGGGSIWLF